MDILRFISILVQTLAWPATVLIVFFSLKQPLSRLLLSLRKLKYKDFSAEFNKLESRAEEIQEPVVTHPIPENERGFYSTLEEQISEMSSISPQGAILIAWAAVETAIHSAAVRLGMPMDLSHRSLLSKLAYLTEKKINPEIIYTIHDMRRIRNKVAHVVEEKSELYPAQAVSYGHTADKIIRILENLRERE